MQKALDNSWLKYDMRAAPDGVDRDQLAIQLFEVIRAEYGPLEVSQEETIYLVEMNVASESDDFAWRVRVTHSIDLDFCSVSDKRESNRVELKLDRELRPVGDVSWERLKAFHIRQDR